MSLKLREQVGCDVLVVGGGGAGLRAAIAARAGRADVLLVSKYSTGRTTNTYISKAIIAASGWGASEDGKDVHANDTVEGGRFLNDRAKVAVISERIVSEIAFLRECGVGFGMEGGKPRVIKIPGHRHARHLHGRNWTGGDLVLPLVERAKQAGVRFEDHLFVTRLLESDGAIAGAAGLAPDGTLVPIRAKAVVLATGGYSQVFLNTNNAPGITGDGLCLAYELGAALQDMELVQFYPTATGRRGSVLLLYEKLLAREESVLRNERGEDVLAKHGFPDPTRVTRDQLAQLVMKEIKDDPGGGRRIVMDLEALPEEKARELSLFIPPAWWKGQKRFEVTPTAHFCMGGIATDRWGETSRSGLFAAGEVAAGAHGANRLGGNALAEVFAMGSLVGAGAAERSSETALRRIGRERMEDEAGRLNDMFSEQGVPPGELIRDLKTLMWRKVGIIREKDGLQEALGRIREPWPRAAVRSPGDLTRLLEFQNMRLVSEMLCLAALRRTESRGSHYRIDHPGENSNEWLKNIVFRKGDSGMDVEVEPVSP